jgi:hypothetical protein
VSENLEIDRITSGMIMSLHLAEVSTGKAMSALRSGPAPQAHEGLHWASTFLMSPLRAEKAMFDVKPTGAALLAAWDNDEALDRYLSHASARPYDNGFRARFEPVRTVGAWPGLLELPRREIPVDDHPIGVLTLARVRMNRAVPFVAAASHAERDAAHHPAFLEGTSLIKPPNQVATFSLWRSVKEMRQYTVGSYPGGHVRAMKRHEERDFHHETIFVRLRPYAVDGHWNGRNPLDMLKPLTTN